MRGPLSGRDMVAAAADQQLRYDALVCGTTSAAALPPLELFEPLGLLLEGVQAGGRYMLVGGVEEGGGAGAGGVSCSRGSTPR